MPFRIFILPHAKQRMRERNITERQIESALHNPDKLHTDGSHPNRFLAKKIVILDNKPYLLLVVFERDSYHTSVITVIATSKILKYL